MAKIPFDIKFKPQIESGEYKVETRSGRTARVVCWDRVGTHLVVLVGKDEDVLTYNPDGTTGQQMPLPSDLFIITPEEELTEFENGMLRYLQQASNKKDDSEIVESTKKYAAELLELAREELIANDTVLKEYAEVSREQGKAEALKDLPRWIPNKFDKHNFETCKAYLDTPRYLCYQDKMIDVSELVEKLPGFKEDEK